MKILKAYAPDILFFTLQRFLLLGFVTILHLEDIVRPKMVGEGGMGH